MTETTATSAPEGTEPTATEGEGVPFIHTGGAVRATWKGHGKPATFTYWGAAPEPDENEGKQIAKVLVEGNKLKLKMGNGRVATGGEIAAGTKFWASDLGAPEAPAQPKQQRAARTFDPAGIEEFTCQGACATAKPVRQFPTTTGGLRGVECRACRNTRTGRTTAKAAPAPAAPASE
jgi:hypothetical protein